MTERDLAVSLWEELIDDLGGSGERSKARALLQRVQGRGREDGMPDASIEWHGDSVAAPAGEAPVVDAPAPPSMPEDLHELLSLFHSA